MRDYEERVAAVKRRVAEREREKGLRRSRIAAISAAAVCLTLMVGGALAMPEIVGNMKTGDYSNMGMAGSIFRGSAALGYIAIGLLAFCLGVCVTILCFCIRRLEREEPQTREKEDGNGTD